MHQISHTDLVYAASLETEMKEVVESKTQVKSDGQKVPTWKLKIRDKKVEIRR